MIVWQILEQGKNQVDSFWNHLEIAGALLIPLTLYWLDLRRSSKRNADDIKTDVKILDTKVTPIANHWNKRGPW
jgi:hypothetical protein